MFFIMLNLCHRKRIVNSKKGSSQDTATTASTKVFHTIASEASDDEDGFGPAGFSSSDEDTPAQQALTDEKVLEDAACLEDFEWFSLPKSDKAHIVREESTDDMSGDVRLIPLRRVDGSPYGTPHEVHLVGMRS